MTIAQQLEQKGRVEGRKEGWEEGIHEGIQEGIQFGKQRAKRAAAYSMLQHGFDYDVVMKITGMNVEELVSLDS